MADDLLITVAELESAARRPPGHYANDPFAIYVIEGFSTVVRDHGDPTWTATTVPSRVKLIIRMRAADYILNPNRYVATAIAGGPSERRTEDAVRGFTLSKEEIDTIATLAEKPSAGAGTLSVISLSQGRDASSDYVIDHVPDEMGIVLMDEPQNAGGDWLIPLTSSNDPGGPR